MDIVIKPATKKPWYDRNPTISVQEMAGAYIADAADHDTTAITIQAGKMGLVLNATLNYVATSTSNAGHLGGKMVLKHTPSGLSLVEYEAHDFVKTDSVWAIASNPFAMFPLSEGDSIQLCFRGQTTSTVGSVSGMIMVANFDA